VGPKGV